MGLKFDPCDILTNFLLNFPFHFPRFFNNCAYQNKKAQGIILLNASRGTHHFTNSGMSGGYPSVDLSKLKTYNEDTSPNSAHSCSTYVELFVGVATYSNVNYILVCQLK